MKYVYVVTSTEMGWDCVCGVYEKEEDAYSRCYPYNPHNLNHKQIKALVDDGETAYVITVRKLE